MGSDITAFVLPEILPGEQWIPSNGTVGHSFVEHVCGDCARNDDYQCEILARSFAGEAVEWRSTAEGQACLAYVPLGESLPQAPCPHTAPLDLSGP